MQRNKIRDIVISVIIAIAIWVYAILNTNPVTTTVIRNVTVAVSGVEALTERGLSIVGETKYTVDLDVSGTRKDIGVLTAADFSVSTNVASLNLGAEELAVSVVAPRGITVNEVIKESIPVKVENYVTEPKLVKLVFGETPDDLEQTVFAYTNEINVCGARSDVAAVSFIQANLDSSLLSKDIARTIYLDAVPMTHEGLPASAVELVSDKVEVNAVLYPLKQVYLKTDVVGMPFYGAESVESMDASAAITIKGSSDLLAGISSIATETIDITGLKNTTMYKLVPVYPEGILPSRSNQDFSITIKISEDAKAAYEQLVSEGGIVIPEE